MSNSQEKLLDFRRSYQLKSNTNSMNNPWKSDVCISNKNKSYTIIKTATASNITEAEYRHKEYYKRYEHDEIPVKDSDNRKSKIAPPSSIGDNSIKSITNSFLDKLEENIYQTISQDLHTEDTSTTSLESNMKHLKATVQEIFNNFQSNMRDFELYKKKLAEILTKTQTDSIADMENFIKEVIQSIISSESSVQSIKTYADNKVKVEVQDERTGDVKGNESQTDTVDTKTTEDASYDESVHLVVEAYKNDNYLTDSTLNENNSKTKSYSMVKGGLNVYLLSSPQCVIKMDKRSLQSEINIKDSSTEGVSSSYVASTENIKKMAAKKVELEQYELQRHEMSDRDIPVKVSFAKKNLCSGDEEGAQKEIDDTSRTFISRICSYICKKFRKNAF